ncbi:kinase-like domain-containing protein [Mucor mucedo]|uniref:kinase-like domain-containing protein n=1 Tax=Mucor mucedo TaxID=29922 RepID=UPI00221F27E6|nr:kinase-like domain-containing protein [Mucor mucedo]KAI7897081.1 kinase-like domain-containing protein [Mucor mucedo]
MSNNEGVVYQNRFERKEKLGSGSYGSVYKVFDRLYGEYYAIKIEPYNTRAKRELNALIAVEGEPGFLELIHYFKEGMLTLHIVFTLVGTTLHDHIKKTFQEKKVDLKTVLLLADQMIDRLRTLHGRGYVHRDLKTDNFAMGLDCDISTLYLLDLGLVKRIKTDSNHHIHMNSGHDLIGNSRYCSLNSHKGYTLSRRDDLESMAYLLISFLKGGLPWSSLRDYSDIYRLKRGSVTELCRGLDPEFADFLRYARHLDFKRKPEYHYIKELFRRVAARHGIEYDGIFPWMSPDVIAKKRQMAEERSTMLKNILFKSEHSLDGNRRIEYNGIKHLTQSHDDASAAAAAAAVETTVEPCASNMHIENMPPETAQDEEPPVHISHMDVDNTGHDDNLCKVNVNKETPMVENVVNPDDDKEPPVNNSDHDNAKKDDQEPAVNKSSDPVDTPDEKLIPNEESGLPNDTCPANKEALSSVHSNTVYMTRKRKADVLDNSKPI